MEQDGTKDTEKKDGAGSANPRAALSLLELSLTNIGPFDSANLRFLDGVDSGEVPVTIITGLNGAGKSIIIDAIRARFGEQFADLERPLWRPRTTFEIRLTMVREGVGHETSLTAYGNRNNFGLMDPELAHLPQNVAEGRAPAPPWVVDFWRPDVPTDSYVIQSLAPLNHHQFLVNALQGEHRNADVTRLICYFDYLRDSREPREKRAGELLHEKTRQIVELSLLDGKLLEVARTKLMPMVQQGAQTVPISSLTSGNAYLIRHMIGMLGKMYAVSVLRGEEPERMCLTPGVVLLDEAENHLHPRWQKRFLRDVLSIFPNLQIVATTHSPFVVGSVPGAKVFVCHYDRETRSTTVDDVTLDYANRPVDDILISPAFNETEAFGKDISELLQRRRDAIERGDKTVRAQVEAELYDRNPSYFSYLKLDEHLQALKAG